MLTFLILAIFMLGFVGQTMEFISFETASKSEQSLQGKVAQAEIFFSESSHCDDCQNDGCEPGDDCCFLECNCSYSAQLVIKSLIHTPLIGKKNLIIVRYYHKYKSPFLDPALKPPLFS